MAFQLLFKDIKTLNGAALITFSKAASQKEKFATLTWPELAQSLGSAIEEKTLTGKFLEVVTCREKNFRDFRHVVVVGLGKASEITHETVRQAVAAGFEAVKSLQVTEALLDFDSLGAGKREAESFAQAAAEGLMLASYNFDELKSSKTEAKEMKLHVVTGKSQTAAVKSSFSDGLVISQCVNFSRFLGDHPGNLMTPEILARKTQEAARGTGVKVSVWDKARIKKEKMNGLLGVSLGSSQDPRFIILEYKGAPQSKKPVVFVGKGLTFDSGGISIKPSAAMEEMKFDKCGGTNVIGALLAMARLKLKVNAIALVPATENMPGPNANKPGDIWTARNGKTYEVNNTDAEGRLILSDALTIACEYKPQAVFDAATLTGAMVIALGNIHTGFFTRNKELKKRIENAAEATGELVWNMPLTDQHVKDMKGTFADLSNISSGKGAGSATAAAFLEQFVDEEIPWAHFDIAGTGWAVGSRLNYCSKKGASGVMVRTFVELAKSYEGGR